MGRIGVGGERGFDTALERPVFITLRIRRNDEDSKNLCGVPNYFSGPSAILEKVREMPNWTGVREMPNWTGVREMPNWTGVREMPNSPILALIEMAVRYGLIVIYGTGAAIFKTFKYFTRKILSKISLPSPVAVGIFEFSRLYQWQ